MGTAESKLAPLFSVIIPTYNRAGELYRCLSSLTQQTYNNFEVIVCDDGSEDNTKEVVFEFNNKLDIKYIKDDNFGGPARPRNKGIKLAKGLFISFLDSDDWWYKNKLEICSKYLSNYDFIFHDVENYNGNFKTHNNFLVSLTDNLINRNPLDILNQGNFIACSSVCVRRELITDNLFPEYLDIAALEDFYAWVSLFDTNRKLRIKHCKHKLSAYSHNQDNISVSNKNYIYKLISLKTRISKNLFIDSKKSCINYLIGVNLLNIKECNRAKFYFFSSIFYSNSFLIKLKSLIRILS
jgi:glycosyltransferase involved in cell wall biosynthesis